jgi:hypothetical protein
MLRFVPPHGRETLLSACAVPDSSSGIPIIPAGAHGLWEIGPAKATGLIPDYGIDPGHLSEPRV